MIIRFLSVLLCLAACSDDHISLQLAEHAAAGQVSYVGPALRQAKRDFFGESGGAGGAAGGGGGFGLEERVEVRGAPPTVTALSLTRRDDIGRGWDLRSSLTVAHAGIQARLPEGLGVLTDPMRVEIRAEAVQMELSVGRAQVLPAGWVLDYGAGLGLQQIAARADVRSALINLVSHTDLTQPYALVHGRVTSPQDIGLSAGLMLFKDGGPEYRVGIFQQF
jgi:hypothetical protein